MSSKSSTPKRYADASYQAAHDDTYAHPLDPNIPRVLPPGITQQQFDDALRKFEQAIGSSSSVYTGKDLKDFVDPYDLPEEGHGPKIPGAAICVGSVEDLRAVLKIANDTKIPVWVVSRGKNLGYGGPAPVVPGSVILDLHRINKVIEVNEKLAYAVVEPGVTFTDLYKYCADRQLKVWPSTASLGWGSVIGNTLDRGMGFVPMGMHHHHIAGLEVILANGDIIRTGQFSSTKSPSAHLTNLTFGPTIDGLFLQSNLGIVTKMGIHMQRQPEAYMSCRLDMPEPDDLATIVDLLGELRRNGTLSTFTYVYPILMEASLYKQRHEWHANMSEPIPEWRLREIMRELNCGWWMARFSFMGPKQVIEAHYKEVVQVVSARAPTGRLSQTTFTGGEKDGLVDAASVPMPHGGQFVGVPDIEGLAVTRVVNSRAKANAPGAHAAYSPILPLDGKFVLEWFRCAKGIYEKHGVDLLEDFYFNDRCTVSVCEFPWEKTDAAQRQKVAAISAELFEAGKQRGLTKYRSHINHMGELGLIQKSRHYGNHADAQDESDKGADLFDFNDHAYRRFVETLKDSLDPNGILSPGKQGIWPRHLRYLSHREPSRI